MSARDTLQRRNRAFTRQLLEREIAFNRSEARVLREHARRLAEKAFILEREAAVLRRELVALHGDAQLPMLLLRQAG